MCDDLNFNLLFSVLNVKETVESAGDELQIKKLDAPYQAV